MNARWLLLLFLAAHVGLPSAATAVDAQSLKADRLDRAAPVTSRFAKSPLAGIAQAGGRLVAVGMRGLIIVSDDAGKTWQQVRAPVASDLLAVQFPTPTAGWIVGHDGVVLHSTDGGLNWRKQLDGRQTKELLLAHFTQGEGAAQPNAGRWVDDVKLNYQNGPEQALLDVWFEDEHSGFVAGSFGTLLRTDDGGKTWRCWMERVEADNLYHYNAIRGIGGEVYIASEKGQVFVLDRARQRFVPRATGYKGSFYGLAGDERRVVAVGLRGNAYRSRDRGATWEKLDTGLLANLNGIAALDDHRYVLVSQDGRALLADANDRFVPLNVPQPTLLTSVQQASRETLVLTGLNGVQTVRLP